VIRHRYLIAAAVGLGLVSLSVALGSLYNIELEVRASLLEAELRGHSLTDSEQDTLLAAFDKPSQFWTAFVGGTAGIGLLGFGGVLSIFELAVLRIRRRAPLGERSLEDIHPRGA